jgi:hypothetical protein
VAAHTQSMSNPHSRVSAGTPSGGQFDPGMRSETGVSLDAGDERPVSALGIDEWDDVLLDDITQDPPTSNVLDTVSICRDPEGFFVRGETTLDLADGLRLYAKPDIYDTDTEVDDAELDAWLNKHSADIDEYLLTEYDATLDGGCDQWDYQRLEFRVPLTEDATVDDVVDQLEENTKAVQLHNERNGGYGSRSFFGSLGGHLRELDAERN